jgi:hypothetical protein
MSKSNDTTALGRPRSRLNAFERGLDARIARCERPRPASTSSSDSLEYAARRRSLAATL